MKKQICRVCTAFLLSLLLLVSAALFLVPAAADDATYTVTMTFDPDQCSLRLYVDSDPAVDMVSGNVYVAKYSRPVRVEVIPKTGYMLDKIVDGGGVQKNTSATEWSTSALMESVDYIVNCTERTFNVEFVDTNTYEPTSGSTGDFYGLVYHYNTGAPIPGVRKAGYRLTGWTVVSKTGTLQNECSEVGGVYSIPKEISYPEAIETGKIYLKPIFTAEDQTVVREDRIYDGNAPYNAGDLLGRTDDWKAPTDSKINGLNFMTDDNEEEGTYRSYIGYRMLTDPAKYPSRTVIIPSAENPNDYDKNNIVFRYYEPIQYTLVYQNVEGATMTGAPETYTYKHSTEIPNPEKKGYTFTGWKITVVVEGNEVTYTEVIHPEEGKTFRLGTDDGNLQKYISEGSITLTAQWTANVYNIVYDWGYEGADDTAYPKTYAFGTPAAIPAPARKGHNFLGFGIKLGDTPYQEGKLFTELPDAIFSAEAEAITLTAHWQVRQYTITLSDESGKQNGRIYTVTYDTPLTLAGFVPPTWEGHTFLGYWYEENGVRTKCVDASGASEITKWNFDPADCKVTLVAEWRLDRYSVTFSGDFPVGSTVILTETGGTTHIFDGKTPISLPYGTEYQVTVTVPSGYRVTAWDGKALDRHTDVYTSDKIAQTEELVIDVTILPFVEEVTTDPASHVSATVTVDGGFEKGTTLTVERLEDGDALATDGENAIKNGKVRAIPGSGKTDADALEQMKETEAVAVFRISLSKSTSGASYTFSIPLPSDLRDRTGLQVVRYNKQTGSAELLQTRIENGVLIFVTDSVGDVVIFADPVVNLGWLAVLLGVIILLQLACIIILAVCRSKYRDAVRPRFYAFLPLTALTVRFSPASGDVLVLIFGATAIILQIVLVCLLYSTVTLRRQARDLQNAPTLTPAPIPEPEEGSEPEETPAEEEQPDDSVDVGAGFGFYESESGDDPDAIFDEESTDGYGYEETFGEQTEPDAADTETTTYNPYGDGEEDFIEPAPNPKYSSFEEDDPTALSDEGMPDADAEPDLVEDPIFSYGADEEVIEDAEQPAEYPDYEADATEASDGKVGDEYFDDEGDATEASDEKVSDEYFEDETDATEASDGEVGNEYFDDEAPRS